MKRKVLQFCRLSLLGCNLSKQKTAKALRFIGVSLGGAKSFRTNVAVLECYPGRGSQPDKIFLKSIESNLRNKSDKTSDQQILEILHREKNVETVVFDVPLTLPKALRCDRRCPGYEVCDCAEVSWLRDHYERRNQKSRPKKALSPYTQRSCDVFLATELEEKFNVPDVLGANLAPLTARAVYLKNKVKWDCQETFTRAAVWRIGRNLQVNKSYLRLYKHAVTGGEHRDIILKSIEESFTFVYDQDRKVLVKNPGGFEAFICSLMGYFKYKGFLQKRPKGFPRASAWPLLPELQNPS